MGVLVSMGAEMMCPFGVAPSTLIVIPEGALVEATTPAATIMDFVPFENIPPFGMCDSLLNPEVAAATAAALGALTPMPCVPVTTPWVPGAPTVLINGMPALTDDSTCMCAWGGEITVTFPGQVIVEAEG
jgi:Domain of unknown function (DUF4280)